MFWIRFLIEGGIQQLTSKRLGKDVLIKKNPMNLC